MSSIFKGVRWRGLAALAAAWAVGGFLRGAAPEALLVVRAGTVPLILSAPHGGTDAVPGAVARTGIGVAKFTTVTDLRTDRLAEAIAADLAAKLGGRPYLVVARFSRKYVDVNRPAAEAYESAAAAPYFEAYQAALRAACAAVRARWGAGLLIDLHGQGRHAQSILRGTGSGATVAHLVRAGGPGALTGPRSVCGVLARLGYDLLPPLTAAELTESELDGGYIVRTYGSAGGGPIDAIQLEFGTALRRAERLPQTAADVAEALAVFARAYLPPTARPP